MHGEHERGAPGYERADASVRGVLRFAAGLAVVLVIVGFAMREVFVWLDPGPDANAAPQHPLATAEEPPGPRLQATPADDLALTRQREHEQLSTYAWIDRQAGVVRVPIERAIELVAERGLPARK